MNQAGVLLVALTLVASLGLSGSVKAQSVDESQETRWSGLRGLEFPENYPTEEATQQFYDEMLLHRATQVVLWSMPAMTL
jgi:hypothetical protein